MPYHVGKKGSYGCEGFPALKDDGTVMGCHKTAKEAAGQIYAINRSEGNIGKAMVSIGDFVIASCDDEIYVGRVEHVMAEGSVGIEGSEYYMEATAENPAVVIRTLEFESDGGYWEETSYLINVGADEVVAIAPLPLDAEAILVDGQLVPEMVDKVDGCCPDESLDKVAPCWDGYTQRGMKPGKGGRMVPNCIPVSKADRAITEGDYVMGGTSEGIVVGQVEHIMREGGTYGTPGTEYAIESTPENPAMAVRMFEQEEDGKFCPTAYSIGMLYNNAIPVDIEIAEEDEYEEEDEYMDKAEGYSPPAGARSAARRAIKFKEDGKAAGAGTAVGWTRARQLANGETLSLSTVKRMYSYFSRHEVDKKGKDLSLIHI